MLWPEFQISKAQANTEFRAILYWPFARVLQKVQVTHTEWKTPIVMQIV